METRMGDAAPVGPLKSPSELLENVPSGADIIELYRKAVFVSDVESANENVKGEVAKLLSAASEVTRLHANQSRSCSQGENSSYEPIVAKAQGFSQVLFRVDNELAHSLGLMRLTAYGYDAFGTRVSQIGTSTTFLYPFKWYSVASSTVSGAKYSTTTVYAFNGDTLLSTVDQRIAFGSASGTAVISFIHPDHLGSTNVVTNASSSVVETLDYYPYGATRISNSTSTVEKRQYIGQFTDD
jgi:hypothetical protein